MSSAVMNGKSLYVFSATTAGDSSVSTQRPVQVLLEAGASPLKKNAFKESPIDVVSPLRNKQLAEFFTGISSAVGVKLDLECVERERPLFGKLLRDHARRSKEYLVGQSGGIIAQAAVIVREVAVHQESKK